MKGCITLRVTKSELMDLVDALELLEYNSKSFPKSTEILQEYLQDTLREYTSEDEREYD